MSRVNGGLTQKTRKIQHRQVVHPPKIPARVGVGSYGRRASPGVAPAQTSSGGGAHIGTAVSGSSGASKAARRVRRAQRQKVRASKNIGQIRKRLTKAAKNTIGGEAKKLDRPFGPNEQITPHQAGLVAEAQGLPGKTYAQIAKGESTLRPGAPNPDDGYPSLYQMTPSVQSSSTRQKWDRIASKHPGGPTNPIVAAKQAKVLAGSGTGVENYYGTGYVTNSNAHMKGGPARARKELYGKRKPIPMKLKAKAKRVLGPQKTRKIIHKAKATGGTTTTQQLPGNWEGSQKAVNIATRGINLPHSGKRTPAENAAVGGSPTSDHLTTNKNTYAKDLSVSGSQGTATAQRVAKNLGIKNFSPGNYNWYTSSKAPGYRFQILWQVEGHFDHVHVGAEYQGGAATASAVSGGTIGSSAGGVPTGGVGAPGGASGTSPTSSTKRDRSADRTRRQAASAIGGYRKSLKPIQVAVAKAAPTPKAPAPKKIKLGL